MDFALSRPPQRELARLLGREVPLDYLHSVVRRAAQEIRPVVERGTCLVSCADEYQGELRASFDRDVARPLMASVAAGSRRVFQLSNMGGRVEPGALMLASQHFSVQSLRQGAKLLLVEIAAHVGRLRSGVPGYGAASQTALGHDTQARYGLLDRFGAVSPCCGALTLLLDPPASAEAVRHPWFDQLTAFFGEERLAALRADRTPEQMVKTAAIHAVLQSETALADILREDPTSPTHFLVVALVVIHQSGTDAGLLTGFHQLYADGREAQIEVGSSLRTMPGELEIRTERGALQILSGPETAVATPAAAARQPIPRPAALARAAELPEVRKVVERSRAQLERLKQRGLSPRVYARPLLREFLQALAVQAPETAVAALALHHGLDLPLTSKLRELAAGAPSREASRKLLRDLEAQLPQLHHASAQELFELLVSPDGPLASGQA